MMRILLLAITSFACGSGDGSPQPRPDASAGVAITLDLIDPNTACEDTFEELVSARLEVRVDRQLRSPCVSFPQTQDLAGFETALGNAGLAIDELSQGEAFVRLLAFAGPGCDAEVMLCAEATIQLEPDLPRALEMTLYCDTLDDALAELFRRCIE